MTNLVNIDKQTRSSAATGTAQDSWNTPKLILLFLENTIRENEVKPKLHSWSAFKSLLFQIYDHRIMHSQEIYGSINTVYVTMVEHILLYVVETSRNR